MFAEPGEGLAEGGGREKAAARQKEILGHPPRMAPLTPDAFTPEALAMTAAIDDAAGLETEPHVSDWVAIVMRHPALFRAHTGLALILMAGGVLPARDRELAVLRTGWLSGAPFEWSGHVDLGKRLAGLTSEEIERVTLGSAAHGWSAHEAAVLRAVEELIGRAMITDETWAELAKSYGLAQFLELPILIGQYRGLACLQNALRTPVDESFGGLTDR